MVTFFIRHPVNIFIPAKFRPKVNRSTPEYEKIIQREYAIQNVEREIRLLETRMNEFNQQINEIDQTVFTNIDNNSQTEEFRNQQKSKYIDDCRVAEEKSKSEWLSNFEKMKNYYNKEMEEGGDLILKIVDETENQRYENNFRYGRHNHRPRQRYHYQRT